MASVDRVTIVKDKDTHRSKGVAFVLFLDRDGAQNCVRSLDNTEMFGRTLKCTIAKDNGRATEFIKRKYYTDKSRCYECGEFGHLSYNCPHNMLGDREPPPKKKKKKQKDGPGGHREEEDEDESDAETEDPAMDSLAAAIKIQQEKMMDAECRQQMAPPGSSLDDEGASSKIKKYKKDSYFSDEEELGET